MGLKIERSPKRENIWARIFLSGPSGAGKTRGALELASRLYSGSLPIVLINTEPNRGKLYADRFPLAGLVDIEESYHPERFIEAIDAAEDIAPGGALVLDSATHEWYGTDGINQLASRFGDWAKARPLHQKFVDRLQVAQMHVIVCCRAKMKYDVADVIEDGRKKQVVTMLGVGPMQDADFQYEFSLAGMIDRASHEVEWTGHIDALEGTTSALVGEDADRVAEVVTGWLSEGEAPAPIEEAEGVAIENLRSLLTEYGIDDERIERGFAAAKRENRGKLHPTYVQEQTEKIQAKIAERNDAAKAKDAAEKKKADAASK